MKQLFFDLETTGLSFRKHSIHQLSAKVVIDDVEVDSLSLKIKPHPNAKIDPGALKVSATTLEDLEQYPSQEIQFKVFTDFVWTYTDRYNSNDKFTLGGYNINRFDIGFLEMWFALNKNDFFGAAFTSGTLDVMVIATEYFKRLGRKPANMKLKTVAQFVGIDVNEELLHGADYDNEVTFELYKYISSKYKLI